MKWHALLLFVTMVILSGCSSRTIVISPEEIPIQVVDQKISEPVAMASPIPAVPRKPLIAIDAGHGGEDFGTASLTKPTLNEKTLNLATARMLQLFLQQMGYRTLMTRSDDTFISLNGRAELANNQSADLFVSVHYNSAPSPKAEGIEIFYFRSEQNQERSDTSKKLAERILNRVLANSNAKSRGVKHGNLAVIKKTNMPAVLIEGGFMTNDSELKNLRDASYIKGLAWGMAQGIQEYLKSSSIRK